MNVGEEETASSNRRLGLSDMRTHLCSCSRQPTTPLQSATNLGGAAVSRQVLMALAIVSLVLTSACSRRQQEWEAARSADTVRAYQGFLASFPDGEFASQAQARVRELQEAEDWQ